MPAALAPYRRAQRLLYVNQCSCVRWGTTHCRNLVRERELHHFLHVLVSSGFIFIFMKFVKLNDLKSNVYSTNDKIVIILGLIFYFIF